MPPKPKKEKKWKPKKGADRVKKKDQDDLYDDLVNFGLTDDMARDIAFGGGTVEAIIERGRTEFKKAKKAR